MFSVTLATVWSLGERSKCVWLSTNGHLAVPELLHKNITQSHI